MVMNVASASVSKKTGYKTCRFEICINGIEIQLANYKSFICNIFESLCIEHTFACVLFDAHNVLKKKKINQFLQNSILRAVNLQQITHQSQFI